MCEKHEARIQELERELSKAKEKNIKLERENEELKKRLAEFESKLEKHQGIIERTFKPNNKKRHKKPGAKSGHKAHHRPKPKHIDEIIEVDKCPHCGTHVNGDDIRPRVIEDIKVAKPEVKQYNIHRGWCPKCKKLVYPKPVDVLPNMHFGLGLGLLVTFQSYALALPYNKIRFELETYFGIRISEGELCKITQKVSHMFGPKYEKLKQEMRNLEIRYIDETGWRIN
jgi:thiol-disulfide isomerase/thioredoxin